MDKNSTTHFIWYLLCSERKEIKSCFGGKKRSIFSDLSGVLISLATTVCVCVYIYIYIILENRKVPPLTLIVRADLSQRCVFSYLCRDHVEGPLRPLGDSAGPWCGHRVGQGRSPGWTVARTPYSSRTHPAPSSLRADRRVETGGRSRDGNSLWTPAGTADETRAHSFITYGQQSEMKGFHWDDSVGVVRPMFL